MLDRMPIAWTIALLLAGCGARPATPAPTSESTGAAASTEGEPAETEPVAEAPCTEWDPEGDPTEAPLDVAEPPPGARRSASGIRFCILRAGEGDRRPTREDTVRVHYTGWTTDGEMFDSSRARGEPAQFPVGGVIRGWTESLTHMTVGQIRRVWIPEDLAYRGAEGSPAGMLVFDIELIAIE